MVTRSVKISTSRLSVAMVNRTSRPRVMNTIKRIMPWARPRPMRPAATETRTLSVRSWRTILSLPAPKAARTASSRSRLVDRASSMLATLAQAIRSTKATDSVIRRKMVGRFSPIRAALVSRTWTPNAALVSGYCSDNRFPIAAISSSACARLTPGRRRPDTISSRASRSPPVCGSLNGSQILARSRLPNSMIGDTTPTTVCSRPFTRSVRPSTSELPAYLSCQKPCAKRTTGAASSRSSPGRNPRPITIGTRHVSQKLSVTNPVTIRMGSPSPLRMALPRSVPARLSKLRFSRRSTRSW